MPFMAACAQFAPKKAKVAENLDSVADMALQAASEGADLVVFPETATSGYYLEGGVLECALSSEQLEDELARRVSGNIEKPIDLLVGFYEASGGGLYNSAAYLEFSPQRSKTVHVYRKFFLPTYGMFDERRFVSRGHELGVFDTRLGRFAVLICEDVWHSILSTLCAVRGAQAILVPSASPARGFHDEEPENHDRYRRMLRAISEQHGVYTINAHLTGFEGGKGFVGGSMMLDPFGKVIAESPIQEAHLLLGEVDFEIIETARSATPLLHDLQGAWADLARMAASDA